MTNIEITDLITQHIKNRSITFRDLLDKSYQIDSYEKYVQLLTCTKSLFEGIIPEFVNVATEHLEKMENFVLYCEGIEDDKVKPHIESNLKNSLGINYNSYISLQLIFPDSLSEAPERSEAAIRYIYQEVEYKGLVNYIQLLKSPTQIGTFLNDSSKQIVAMHYILFKTGHHNCINKDEENVTIQSLDSTMSNAISDSIQEITAQKHDYIAFMQNEKKSYTTWFENSSQEYDNFLKRSQNLHTSLLEASRENYKALERTYSDKLKVEEPAAFMKNKADEYATRAQLWSLATVVLAGFLLWLLSVILSPDIKISEKIITIQLFNSEMPVYSTIIVFAMITLVIYVLKIFIKMTISSKHLSEEYYQKYVLTYFYLALIKDNKISEEQANIVLSTLFTKADTGLIKNDASNDIESIYKLILSTKSNS